MQLHSLQAQLGDPLELVHSPLALERVDAAEADERLRKFLARLGDEVVGDTRPPGRGLRVPGQEDRHHVQRVVLARQLLERLARDLGAEVRLGGLDVASHRHVQPVRGRQVDVKVDCSQRRN